jgi:ABC-type glycerol-3-phosphate transport system substrate-binding protein
LSTLGPSPTPTPTATPTPTKKVDLDFVMWAFDTPLQERNAVEFAKAYKRDTGVDISVKLTSLPYDAYKASVISRFEGGTKTDVLYVEDNWFSLWENAGWIAPMEKYRPEIRKKYEKDLQPGVLDALTSRISKGMLVGLPYYTDTLTFMYNKRMTEQAGIDEPPKTWDELLDHAAKVKSAIGIDRPLAFAWKLAEWTFEEVLFAMMYSRGQRFLNPDGSANLGEGSAMHQVLEWIAEAGVKRKLIDPASTEMVCENVMEGMKGKLYAYTVLPSYFLFFTNISEAPAAGDWTNAMMPGTGETTQLVRFYAMTNQCVERGDDYIDAAYAFIEWEGGKYDRMGTGEEVYIKPREFALRDGLPFGLIGLLDDPAVQTSMRGWINPDIAKEQFMKTNYIEAKW